MTTRLEVECYDVSGDARTPSRITLLRLEDREGVHATEFGEIKVVVERRRVNPGCEGGHRRKSGYYGSMYYKKPPHNTDIIIDASEAHELAEILKASKRRVSIGTNGEGSQQIGTNTTLIISSDSFYRER